MQSVDAPGGGPTASSLELPYSDAALGRVHAAVGVVLAMAAAHDLVAGGRQGTGLALTVGVAAFGIYAVLILWHGVRDSSASDTAGLNWIDVAWYLLLFAASGGTATLFAFFLLFPILFVALQWGFLHAASILVVSAAGVFAVVAIGTQWGARAAQSFWLVPVAVLFLGYLVAYWASGLAYRRRCVALGADLSRLANPRVGLAFLVSETLERVCRSFRADASVLVTTEPGTPRVFRFSHTDARTTAVALESAGELVEHLLSLPETEAVAGNEGRMPWSRGRFQCFTSAADRRNAARATREACAAIANLFECSSLISAPLYHRGEPAGRLFLVARDRAFGRRDLIMLQQITELISALMENVALVDRLTAEAADHERKRLSRDMHDSAVQPYIGLKFGLEALARKISPDDALAADVHHLLQMASEELAGIRNVVGGLRKNDNRDGSTLLSTVRQQAARFGALFGIHVDVSIEGEIPDDKALEGEVFHIVGEGLANIWRHTQSRKALIRLRRDGNWLVLQFLNELRQNAVAARFMPGSLAGRAAALGGKAEVDPNKDGYTVVSVSIPIRDAKGGKS